MKDRPNGCTLVAMRPNVVFSSVQLAFNKACFVLQHASPNSTSTSLPMFQHISDVLSLDVPIASKKQPDMIQPQNFQKFSGIFRSRDSFIPCFAMVMQDAIPIFEAIICKTSNVLKLLQKCHKNRPFFEDQPVVLLSHMLARLSHRRICWIKSPELKSN